MTRENKRSLLRPLHPERICWGCDRYCRADDLACGNGSERTPHPVELFGEDWRGFAEEHGAPDTVERLFGAEAQPAPGAPSATEAVPVRASAPPLAAGGPAARRAARRAASERR